MEGDVFKLREGRWFECETDHVVGEIGTCPVQPEVTSVQAFPVSDRGESFETTNGWRKLNELFAWSCDWFPSVVLVDATSSFGALVWQTLEVPQNAQL